MPVDDGQWTLLHPDGRTFSVFASSHESAKNVSFSNGKVVPGQLLAPGAGLARDVFGEGSQQDYAARILFQYRRLKATIGQRDLDLSTHDALELGELIAEADMAKDAARGVRFNAGRKPGARGALGRVVLDILKGDPKKSSKDVLIALKALAKAHVIVMAVDADPRKGYVVRWRDPMNGSVRRTTWRSIRDSMLPSLRRQAEKPPTP